MKKVKLEVRGMMCAHCSKAVSDVFKSLGIDAYINLANNKASFSFDELKLSLPFIARKIKQAGYTLVYEKKITKPWFRYLQFGYSIFSLAYFLIMMILMAFNLEMPHVIHMIINPLFGTISLLLLGSSFIIRSILSLKHRVFSMDVLISLSALLSYALSIYGLFTHGSLYFDAVSMVLAIVNLGHYLTDKLKLSTVNDMKALQDLEVKVAHRVSLDNSIEDIDPLLIEVDDLLTINPFELIPVDGVVVSGESFFDEHFLTGESLLKAATLGITCFGGTMNSSGTVIIKATKTYPDSLLSSMLDEASLGSLNKGKMERISDRIAAIFVPFIILLAIITFFIRFFGFHESAVSSLLFVASVLAVSCPCAFGLAVPLAILAGHSMALKRGILIKNGDVFEKIRQITKIYFDKTGTLTTGKMNVTFEDGDKKYLPLIKGLEKNSSHPLGKFLYSYLDDVEELSQLSDIKVIPHLGISWQDYFLGSPALFKDLDDNSRELLSGTKIYFGTKDKILYSFVIDVATSSTAPLLLKSLDNLKIESYILSGDNEGVTKRLGEELKFNPTHVFGNLTPLDKATIISSNRTKNDYVAFLGDGINDILALKEADLGIAVYGSSSYSQAYSDLVLTSDDLLLIPVAVKIAKATYYNIIENFVWAFAYNLVTINIAIYVGISPAVSSLFMIISNLVLILNVLRFKYFGGH